MKKAYELLMKNGKTVIAATDEQGYCQFRIGGLEFTLYGQGSRKAGITFSVEEVLCEEGDSGFFLQEEWEVLSIREVSAKQA